MTALPTLRLFSPESSFPAPVESPPSNPRSLRNCFEELLLPELRNRKRNTIEEYLLHIRRWEEFLSDPESADKYRIRHPVLVSAVDKKLLMGFRDWLLERRLQGGGREFSERTVNKHLGSLKAILLVARDEQWVNHVPRVRPLEYVAAAEKRYFSYEQLSALYEACDVAIWPRRHGIGAATWWRAAIVWFFNYGFRTQELTRYESKQRSLVWCGITWDQRCPLENSHAQCPFGWFSYLPEKQERHKPLPLVLPMNETTKAHLWSISPAEARPQASCFDWPFSPDRFGRTWHEICAAAGIVGMTIKHFRKSCVTWHDYHAGWPISQFITGHAPERDASRSLPVSRVAMKHYNNGEHALVDHMAAFPQPDAFTRGLGKLRRQSTLF